MTKREPILIWGAGAIGGTLGAYWARAGCRCCWSTWSPSMCGLPHHGLEIAGPVENSPGRVRR